MFVKKRNLDFGDAEDAVPEDELELTPEKLGERLEIKFVKFQSVDQLTLFIASNQGDEESSAVASIRLWGAPVAGMNMGEFKRVAGEKGEGE